MKSLQMTQDLRAQFEKLGALLRVSSTGRGYVWSVVADMGRGQELAAGRQEEFEKALEEAAAFLPHVPTQTPKEPSPTEGPYR